MQNPINELLSEKEVKDSLLEQINQTTKDQPVSQPQKPIPTISFYKKNQKSLFILLVITSIINILSLVALIIL